MEVRIEDGELGSFFLCRFDVQSTAGSSFPAIWYVRTKNIKELSFPTHAPFLIG